MKKLISRVALFSLFFAFLASCSGPIGQDDEVTLNQSTQNAEGKCEACDNCGNDTKSFKVFPQEIVKFREAAKSGENCNGDGSEDCVYPTVKLRLVNPIQGNRVCDSVKLVSRFPAPGCNQIGFKFYYNDKTVSYRWLEKGAANTVTLKFDGLKFYLPMQGESFELAVAGSENHEFDSRWVKYLDVAKVGPERLTFFDQTTNEAYWRLDSLRKDNKNKVVKVNYAFLITNESVAHQNIRVLHHLIYNQNGSIREYGYKFVNEKGDCVAYLPFNKNCTQTTVWFNEVNSISTPNKLPLDYSRLPNTQPFLDIKTRESFGIGLNCQ